MRKSAGQTSLILILLTAVALIFFAITLNWGKIAQIKMQTTIAANTGASLLASSVSSYGEQVLQTTLGGHPKYCKSTSVWIAIGVLIIAIIILILTIIFPPLAPLSTLAWIALIGSVVLAAASLALQVLVIQPGLTSLWNKLQANLAIEERFLETGISTSLQTSVNDQVQIPDYFDEDNDGRFFGNSDDVISRFGFYYTERLKASLPPDLSGIDKFTAGLKEMVYYNPGNALDCSVTPGDACCPQSTKQGLLSCTGVKYADHFAIYDPAPHTSTSALNNPCCVPLYGTEMVANPNYGKWLRVCPVGADCVDPFIPKQIRPASFTSIDGSTYYCAVSGPVNVKGVLTFKDVPQPGCAETSPYGYEYPYVYDPVAENNASLSFREQLGRDDQNKIFVRLSGDPKAIQTPGSINNSGTCSDGSSCSATQACLNGGTCSVDFIAQDASGYSTTENNNKGLFPLLWEMTEGFPNVNTNAGGSVSGQSQCNWCDKSVSSCLPSGGVSKLGLASCTGADCCINQFAADSPAIDSRQIDSVHGLVDASGVSLIKQPSDSNGVPSKNICPITVDTSVAPTTIDWKRGDDQFCGTNGPDRSTTGVLQWPYSTSCKAKYESNGAQCSGSGSVGCNSSCDSTNANLWTEDSFDLLVSGLGGLSQWEDSISNTSSATLKTSFLQWYPIAGSWIAPKCGVGLPTDQDYTYDPSHSECNSGVCSDGSTCSSGLCADGTSCPVGNEGQMRIWRREMGGDNTTTFPDTYGTCSDGSACSTDTYTKGTCSDGSSCVQNPGGGWYKIFDNWLTNTQDAPAQNLANDQSWCVPQTIKDYPNSNLSPSEKQATFVNMTDTATAQVSALNQCMNSCSDANCGTTSTMATLGLSVSGFSEATQCSTTTAGAWKTPATDPVYFALVRKLEDIEATNSNYKAPDKSSGLYAGISDNTATATVKEVSQCLNWNKTNDQRFKDCEDFCQGNATSTGTDGHALTVADCDNLPRSLVNGFDDSSRALAPLPATGVWSDAQSYLQCQANCALVGCSAKITAINSSYDPATMCVSGKITDPDTNTALISKIDGDFAGSVCKNFSGIQKSQALAVNQAVKMNDRYTFVNDLYNRAHDARELFRQGYQQIDAFLKGAGRALMAARKNYEDHLTTLPNFAIYGWQNAGAFKGTEASGADRGGYWHIVKIDGFSPARCGTMPNCLSELPKPITYTKGFLGTTRCYELVNHDGPVYIRVTRYDEDHNPITHFANQIKLWQFKFSNPKYATIPVDPPGNLADICGGSGILESTLTALGIADDFTPVNGGAFNNLSGDVLRQMKGAFMLNNIPVNKTASTTQQSHEATLQSRQQQCYCAIKPYLSLGVSSESCAEYYLGSNNHMTLKFISCPAGFVPPDPFAGVSCS